MRITALLTAALFLAGQMHAADFYVEQRITNAGFADSGAREPSIIIGMRGEIVEGDAERLRAFITENAKGKRTALYGQGLSMDSPGGSLDAAIALAEVIWEYGMTTYVQAGKRCLSGCAIAFMAGRHAETDEYSIPRRFMHPTAQLGFHAPFALANTSNIPADVAKLLLLDAERGGSLAASKLVKLAVNGILSSSLVEALLQYDKDNFLYIDTVDRAGRWQIGLLGEARLRSPNDILRPADVTAMEMHCNNQLYWLQDISAEDRKGTSRFFEGTLIFDGLDHSCKYSEGTGGGYAYNIDNTRGGTVSRWQTLPPQTKLSSLASEQPTGANLDQDPFANPPPREVSGPCQEGYRWVGGWGGPNYRNSKAFSALRNCAGNSDIFRMECKHGEQMITILLLVSPFTPQVTINSTVEMQIDGGLRMFMPGKMQINSDSQPYFIFKLPRQSLILQDAAKGNRATFWVDNHAGSMHLAGTKQAISAMQSACL
jgi:hypothetical protein